MQTIKFITLGCKVNQYDTQSIRESFLRQGYQEKCNSGPADLYLINTCTVTANADKKSRYAIHHSIKENPKAKVIITGCLVQKDHLVLTKIKGVTCVISKSFFREGISNFSEHTRAFLKIQDGCNNHCSYCKVPFVRGASRSRALVTVVKEARELVKNGFKEIVLTGICLGSYGKDLGKKLDLVDVIKALEGVEGLLRIRLSSIEAGDVSLRLINQMSNSKRLCRHLHIPMQSGDNEILKKMNRSYTREYYIDLVSKLKNLIPQIAITTDVLVGFPGESQSNFENTIRLIQTVQPLKTHIFPFSDRKISTYNASEPPQKMLNARLELVRLTAHESSQKYMKNFLNKKATVLIEGQVKLPGRVWEGYSDNYIKVHIHAPKMMRNSLVLVKFSKICAEYMLADLHQESGRNAGVNFIQPIDNQRNKC